jgi:hypothetical protein
MAPARVNSIDTVFLRCGLRNGDPPRRSGIPLAPSPMRETATCVHHDDVRRGMRSFDIASPRSPNPHAVVTAEAE